MSTNDARESGFFPCATADRFESDDDLIAGMLANDPAAWREFQAKYDRLIIRCITKVTRRFASMVSQDDVREVYANLYVSLLGNDMHKLRTFDPERGNRFSSWIGLLAINAAYDYLRTLKREPPTRANFQFGRYGIGQSAKPSAAFGAGTETQYT